MHRSVLGALALTLWTACPGGDPAGEPAPRDDDPSVTDTAGDSGDPGGDTGAPEDSGGQAGRDTADPGDDTGEPGDDTGEPGGDTGQPGETGQDPSDTGEPGDDTGDPGDTGDAGPGGLDPDGDGLSSHREERLGTDPLVADTDGDGYDDGAEVEAGTDPTWEWSHPFAGGYATGTCDGVLPPTGPTGTARYTTGGRTYTWAVYQPGDVAENFVLQDQHGEEVSLYAFCGRHVMFTFGAGWCPNCQAEAAEAQGTQDRYAGAVQVMELMLEDAGGAIPTRADLEAWADRFGLTSIPVLAVPLEEQDDFEDLFFQYETDMGIPTTVHLGPDMTVLSVDDYITDPGLFL